MNKRYLPIVILTLLFTLLAGGVWASHTERAGGQHFTLLDEQNKVVHQTGFEVYPGDIYIAADNSRYRVVEIISDNTARCVYQGKETMPDIADLETDASLLNREVPVVKTGQKPTIAVYHTHSDESYVPTDGKESINGNGGIYDVGEAMVNKFREMGFKVDYNKANHNPHDINAYNRSRKTAASLLKDQPDVILDVHRDAVPPDQYQTKVKGQEVTKIKLVVGRSNPNMKTNLEFAKKIKAVMDKKEPGLSNGIYMGKGSYNQDLSPRAMLIEIGSHTNPKQDAEKAAALFADVLPTVIGASAAGTGTSTEPAAKPMTGDDQKAGSTLLIILVVVGAAIGIFYLINRGSTQK
ncbi:MAG TPA: stage II sporulation protein P [Syntrophomonas sp.]|jgi:stage II sporulation protein P|nr:stage II sporulation protein P [Syntrophomonas sp.]HCF70457.1 stage II sporulation protein P [Syntrophomonas sp.]